ncbi:unnamed protein product [Brassica rapa]|uniref:Uncharacterized protein n=1 Tax=Brassica campestris TaxID=3711 RepID=A0A8D9GWE6_BRACM|nr:unnamed protein product [Brassica rapa]
MSRSSLRGTYITRPPRVDRNTIRGARVERFEAPTLHRYINRLRSIQKSTRIFRSRVDWVKREQKRRSRTDSRSNRRRSRRKDSVIRATSFPETIAGETDVVRATISQKRKLATTV